MLSMKIECNYCHLKYYLDYILIQGPYWYNYSNKPMCIICFEKVYKNSMLRKLQYKSI